MKDLALADVYKHLEPGPVVLLTTSNHGRANVMTMSWHMMVDFEPPLIACIVSEGNYSFAALQKTQECVIAIPTADMAAIVVGVGNCSGRDVDKFQKFGLRHAAAKHVAAPLLPDCFCNLECTTVNVTLAKAYNLFVFEVVKAWIDPGQHQPQTLHHEGFGHFVLDGKRIQLESAMP